MPQYQAPTEEMKFILHDWLKITTLYQQLDQTDPADKDLINAVIDEAAKFAETQLSPLNHVGDLAGCEFRDGKVKAPEGFKQAYLNYCEAGWASLRFPTEFGGQGLPPSLAVAVAEMNASANTSWSMYPGLTHGVIHALSSHGSDELKQRYLHNLVQGRWTGTMCLTEAHCGSDLGLLKTKAELQSNGSYSISGTKIFISAGEHDLSENIIHLVLARRPDAPSGTRGISLFVVPKIIDEHSVADKVEENGLDPGINSGNRETNNNVTCGSIEHKMGIKASATCVMNFDQSIGYLVGEVNNGLSCMFTMMNSARLATGIQGYAIADLSRSASLNYAKERLQMRSLSGPKAAEKPADPIIVHPDVKRMLFTQKSLIEGCRGLAYYVATLLDQEKYSNDADGSINARLGLLTPICKAFMSEAGFESANHAVQVLGGHGYIAEWQLEQQVRDARITMIYEGTNGIQALDLLGRKVLRDQAKTLNAWIADIQEYANTQETSDHFSKQAKELSPLCNEWLQITQSVAQKAQNDMEEVGAAAFDFLMYSGYVSLSYILLQMAVAAQSSKQSNDFKQAKIETLNFYNQRILPRTKMHKAALLSGNDNLQCTEFAL